MAHRLRCHLYCRFGHARRGAAPADLEKEKQGTLLLVDLRIGTGQSLELFAGKSAGESLLHHVAVAVDALEAARDALERLGVGVPPRASPEAKPLGNFFARDPNGRDIEAGRPREPAQLSPSGSEGPAFFASDEETIRRFYGGALGVDVCPVPCALIAKTSQGDRIDLLNSDGMEPALVVKLESIGRARQWLEERPARAAYPESLEIQPGARTTLVMQDPDGMVMRIEHKGAGPPLSDTCPAGPLSLSHVALRASDIERPWPSTAMFSVSRKPRGCAMPT